MNMCVLTTTHTHRESYIDLHEAILPFDTFENALMKAKISWLFTSLRYKSIFAIRLDSATRSSRTEGSAGDIEDLHMVRPISYGVIPIEAHCFSHDVHTRSVNRLRFSIRRHDEERGVRYLRRIRTSASASRS